MIGASVHRLDRTQHCTFQYLGPHVFRPLADEHKLDACAIHMRTQNYAIEKTFQLGSHDADKASVYVHQQCVCLCV